MEEITTKKSAMEPHKAPCSCQKGNARFLSQTRAGVLAKLMHTHTMYTIHAASYLSRQQLIALQRGGIRCV